MNKKVLFQELYDKTYSNLRRFVQCRSRSPHIVDDILQEIYLETFRHINELSTHENQIGWIYKTAEYKIKKLNEVYDRNMSREISCADFEEPFIYSQSGNTNADAEGYSYKEIGQMTGNTESGSKMRIVRLVEKLRKNIGGLSNKLFFIFI